jgi:hypothetical protein
MRCRWLFSSKYEAALGTHSDVLMATREGVYCISTVSSFGAGRNQFLASHPESQGAAATILDCPLEDEDTE